MSGDPIKKGSVLASLSSGIVLGTYNGEKYLLEQLESIAAQSRLPDQLVISDDMSTDGTWNLLTEWAATTSINVLLIRNEVQLGISQNYYHASKRLTTDLIFTCDQDDIWYRDKLYKMAGVFEMNPDVILAHSDSDLVDSTGRPLDMTLFQAMRLTNWEKSSIEAGNALRVICRRNVVSGATMVFRKALVDIAGPAPGEWYPDHWLAINAAAVGRIFRMQTSTLKYRQHGSNTVGARREGWFLDLRRIWWRINGESTRTDSVENIVAYRTLFLEHVSGSEVFLRPAIDHLRRWLNFSVQRSKMPRNMSSRFLKIFNLLLKGEYHKYSLSPWSDLTRDLVDK